MGKTLTIFDLDNTLIKGDSSTVWSRFMVREGWVNDPGYLAREAMLMDDYDRGEMNIADYVALIQAPLIGVPKQEVDSLLVRCVREEIVPRVYPQAWDLIRTLQARGEQMLVISASVSLLVQAVAAELGIKICDFADSAPDNLCGHSPWGTVQNAGYCCRVGFTHLCRRC